MKKVLTKKIVLVVSGIIGGGVLIINYFGTVATCGGVDRCIGLLASTLDVIFLPVLSVLFFSLITYKLPEQVFRSWFNHFAIWWIPFSMLLTFITPHSGGGWGPGINTGPGDTSFILSFLFVVISIVIILVSSIRVYRKGK